MLYTIERITPDTKFSICDVITMMLNILRRFLISLLRDLVYKWSKENK